MKPAIRMLTKGDRVRITFEGRTMPGEIVVASQNGKSLILEFADGEMAVVDEGGGYVEVTDGEPVKIELVRTARPC